MAICFQSQGRNRRLLMVEILLGLLAVRCRRDAGMAAVDDEVDIGKLKADSRAQVPSPQPWRPGRLRMLVPGSEPPFVIKSQRKPIVASTQRLKRSNRRTVEVHRIGEKVRTAVEKVPEAKLQGAKPGKPILQIERRHLLTVDAHRIEVQPGALEIEFAHPDDTARTGKAGQVLYLQIKLTAARINDAERSRWCGRRGRGRPKGSVVQQIGGRSTRQSAQ